MLEANGSPFPAPVPAVDEPVLVTRVILVVAGIPVAPLFCFKRLSLM